MHALVFVDHNATHAADVLHATAYLLSEPIPEFDHAFQDDETVRVRKTKTTGNMFSAFSMLELFACYMAAVMHDFDHPGRTNAFLVATRDPLVSLVGLHEFIKSRRCKLFCELSKEAYCIRKHVFMCRTQVLTTDIAPVV